MKSQKKKLAAILACSLAISPAAAAIVSDTASPGLTQVSAAAKTPQKGWYTTKKKNRQYYRRGKFVTGFQKIGKKYYYFNKYGALQTKNVKVKNTTYYINSKGVVEAYKKKSTWYYPNGKKMSKTDALDFETLQTAKSIVNKITTASMSKSEKLKVCFDWVMAKPYMTFRTFSNTKGWPAVYANDHFLRGGGNCLSDASAFAYLAKVLGYKVYVCTDSSGSGAHSWAEINGLVYDPLFAQSKSYSGNYGVPYGTYKLTAILHIEI